MTRILFVLLLLFVTISNSCVTKMGLVRQFCDGHDAIHDVSSLSEHQLASLARSLKAQRHDPSGCRDALLAQVYAAQDRASLASEYFSIAAEKMPEMRDYFMLAKARTELARKDFAEAYHLAHGLLTSHAALHTPSFAQRVRRVLADIAVEKKDAHQIIKTHQELLRHGFAEDEVFLFNLASSLARVGEHKNADDVYRRLLVNFPTSPEAARALQLKSLANYDLALKETEKRFDKLIAKLAFDQAISDADQLLADDKINNDNEARGHIESLAIKSLVLSNQFEKAYQRGVRRRKNAGITNRELESFAWTLGKLGHYVDASAMYGRVMADAKEKEQKAKACFFKGFSLYEASLYSMALFSWRQCHDEVSGSGQHENYLWYQALASILSGSNQAALDYFKELKVHFPRSKDDEKYTYFLAHTLRSMNKPRDADAIVRELGNKSKPSYYVLLARQTLGMPAVKGTAIAPDALSKLAKTTGEGASKNALILFHLGFKEEARDLVLSSSAEPTDKAAMLQHLGFYHDAWQRSHLLNQDLSLAQGKLRANARLRSSFPMPYRLIVDEFSRKYDVNKNLLYAIIQAESGFLENAVSFRGAIGLMQMMPFVANDLSSRMASLPFDREQLKNPATSIELGTLFVATLQRQFGNPHLVVAAYNAGPHQVQKWLDLFGHLPTELFVERIPFKQTRDYIKTVLPSESFYHAMTGENFRLAL